MKKIILTALVAVFAMTGMAQNLQLHYDFGRKVNSLDTQADRPNVTATFEHFSLDGAGSWFYFIDLDFYHDGVAAAYTEVSREFKIGNKGWAAHLEYDGGVCSKKFFSGRYQQAALVGAAYNSTFKNGGTWSLQMMYRQHFKNGGHRAFSSAQLTGVWSKSFANNAITFAGFFDFWRDEKSNNHGKLTFATEPQLWFNLNSIEGLEKCPISIGTEQEIYNGFYTDDSKFTWNPTIAVKCAL